MRERERRREGGKKRERRKGGREGRRGERQKERDNESDTPYLMLVWYRYNITVFTAQIDTIHRWCVVNLQ